jgi:hypothetical protein
VSDLSQGAFRVSPGNPVGTTVSQESSYSSTLRHGILRGEPGEFVCTFGRSKVLNEGAAVRGTEVVPSPRSDGHGGILLYVLEQRTLLPRFEDRARPRQRLYASSMPERIVYLQLKTGYNTGRRPAWIARVEFTRT